MTTFSQLVDEIVVELLRPDLRTTAASYLNQTIREVHMHEQTQLPIYFESNRLEDEGTVATLPALWDIPSVPRFQALETLYYPDFGEYARKRHPSKIRLQKSLDFPYYWYRTGSAIALGGLEVGHDYEISWFEYPRTLTYYAAASRPMTYATDSDTPTYNTVGAIDYNSTPELQAEAERLTTNWLIQRWAETLKQGVRNKIWVRLGEETRLRASYSIYSGLRAQLINAESMELTPEYGE